MIKMNDKLKVVRRLNPEYSREYIISRFKEKFPEISEGDLESLDNHIKGSPKGINYIIFEDYNLPDLHWRVYYKGVNYQEVVEDYFSDCDESIYELADLGCIYDVDKDKFVKVSFHTKEIIKEV